MVKYRPRDGYSRFAGSADRVSRSPKAFAGLWSTALALMMVIGMIIGMIIVPSCLTTAQADTVDGSSPSASSATNDASTTVPNGDNPTITIDTATAVVTSTSGYHLKITITNPTARALTAGNVTLNTNIFYTFNSRTDIQEWAQGQSPIPTFDQLGKVNVPAIGTHATATVSIDVSADQSSLKAIANWGPKPMLIRYTSGGTDVYDTHSFMTRSSDGLPTGNTPALKITMAMPLASDSWQLDTDAVGSLMTDKNNTELPQVGQTVTLGNAGSRIARDREQLISSHSQLQVVADPTYLKSLALPTTTDAVMQPGDFDITTSTAINDDNAYSEAGLGSTSWNAATSEQQFQTAVGDKTASTSLYAWQGNGRWTLKALAAAKTQGYSTVIADQGFDEDGAATVHTGKYVVPTSAGNVTVLAAQRELSNLARGKATSQTADGENSSAGRLARFMAQSAFYQMEQPYLTRNLLVCFGVNTLTADENALLSAVEHASWLSLTSLSDLSKAEAYESGDAASEATPTTSGLSTTALQETTSMLQQLRTSRDAITRFSSAILAGGKQANTKAGSSDAGDAQSLARQDANGERSKNGTTWITRITQVHDQMALHALGAGNTARHAMAKALQRLSDQLFSGVSITPMEKMTVVSETASMPVTISNSHPYPVTVKVSSITDSMEIVTSRFVTVTVPARGNAQVTFTIRVSTAGQTVAHIKLLDQRGKAFSSTQNTPIISTVQISDMSGFVFIAIAIVFGVLGLWRQFHRKKDPNE